MFKSLSEYCFCAFCKHERRYYSKKHLSWTNVALCFMASLLLMFGLWQKFDPKMLVVFVVSLICAEAFIQIRWKLSLNCPYCGFDPVLYVKDPDKACDKVKKFLDHRNDGALILSKKDPFTNLHKRVLPAGEKLTPKVSRRI